MKKIFLTAMIFISFMEISLVYATDEGSSSSTTVTVTEKIPGLNCDKTEGTDETNINNRKYTCTIEGGFGSVMKTLGGLIKYFTFLTILVGVLLMVISGIKLSLSGVEQGAKEEAKKTIGKILTGLILLFLVGFILNTIAPWVYK